MKKVFSKSKLFLVILAASLLAVFIIPIWPAQAVSSELEIISRKEWEADDQYLLNEDDQTIWPVMYQKPEKFIIHHTAGSNGGNDPAATIRAIYYYHAQILGWGDIGYNYLIDSEGNIYEGRKGGDGAIGAHAYRDSGCNVVRFNGAKEGVDFNQGTIGIALLGNYENNQPNEKAVNSLKNLIAQKGAELGIKPNGRGDFQDLDNALNVIGHKDVDCTLCPGDNLEDQLANIRTVATIRYKNLRDDGASFVPVAQAKFVKQSAEVISLEPGQEATIWAKFRNTGNFTWRRYFEDTVYLASTDYNDSSLLHLAALPANQIDFTTANVEPGEIGKVSFTIKAPIDQLTATESFQLVYDGKVLPGTSFNIKVEVIGLDLATELSSQDILPATFVNSRIKTTFRFVNRGLTTWQQEDTFLEIFDLNLQPSVYHDQSWSASSGQISLTEKEVASGETGTFTFYLRSPANPGLYRQIYRVVYNNQPIINGRLNFITRVDSHYQAKLISQNIPPAILTTWRPKATIEFKNTGVATWDQNIRLNVYDLGFTPSQFRDRNWLSQCGQFKMLEQTVEPGETATFRFTYHNDHAGIYKQIFRLELLNRDIVVQNGGFNLITRVDNK